MADYAFIRLGNSTSSTTQGAIAHGTSNDRSVSRTLNYIRDDQPVSDNFNFSIPAYSDVWKPIARLTPGSIDQDPFDRPRLCFIEVGGVTLVALRAERNFRLRGTDGTTPFSYEAYSANGWVDQMYILFSPNQGYVGPYGNRYLRCWGIGSIRLNDGHSLWSYSMSYTETCGQYADIMHTFQSGGTEVSQDHPRNYSFATQTLPPTKDREWTGPSRSSVEDEKRCVPSSVDGQYTGSARYST